MHIAPRLTALSHLPHGRRQEAVDALWRKLPGTPLVDPDPDGDPGRRLVTFLWRDPSAAAMLLLVNTLVERHRMDLGPMLPRRVDGTDLWWLGLRLPADLRVSYQFLPLDEPVSAVPDPARWSAMRLAALPDPGNPDPAPHWMPGVRASALVLPDAPEQPHVAARPGVPVGVVERHEVPAPDGPRTVWVHRAAGAPDADLPVAVLLDGQLWIERAPVLVDNLVDADLVPAGLTVLVDSVSMGHRQRELAGDPAFLEFLHVGLPGWLADRWPVAGAPERWVIAGQSLGGGTAVRAALTAPERYGNALAQSAVFGPVGAPGATTAGATTAGGPPSVLPEPVVEALRQSPPVRIFAEVGTLEDRLLPGNRALATALAASGVRHSCREFSGGHELLSWQGGLADGLRYLLAPSGAPTRR